MSNTNQDQSQNNKEEEDFQMIDTSNSVQINMRYFPIQEGYVQAQFLTYMTSEQYENLQKGQSGQAKKKKKSGTIILVLDQSGSMSGKPFEAVKKGVEEVAKTIYTSESFEEFITIFFQSDVSVFQAKTLDEYLQRLRVEKCFGGTKFENVFNYITQYANKKGESLEDISVIFFTDGRDGLGLEGQQQNLKELKNACSKMRSRFLTIGFTASHDAPFLNEITKIGTEMGNFIYIDTNVEGYIEKIQESLASSFEMALYIEGLNLCLASKSSNYQENIVLEKVEIISKIQQDKQNEEEEVEEQKIQNIEEVKEMTQVSFEFIHQIVIKESVLNDLIVKLKQGKIEKDVKILIEEVPNPPEEIKIKASIQLCNKLIFQAIQEVQDKTSGKTTQQIFKEIQSLDSQLNENLKLANSEFVNRKEIKELIDECKVKISYIMGILRNANDGKKMGNEQIAQLNDLAYKAVRQKGFQKKLDERAIKNTDLYEKIEKNIDEKVVTMDFSALETQYKNIIDDIGVCPISVCNLIETMKNLDCMCLCMYVTRPSTAIMDPTKITIKKIIPYFVCSQSYIQSATFALKQNSMAHGGFRDQRQGGQRGRGGRGGIAGQGADNDEEFQGVPIMTGVGRENINAIMPLYLFKEHWDIGRRRAAPVFGFICTNDVMGYNQNQLFTIPFLVLMKCMQTTIEEKGKEIYVKIENYVLETCLNLIEFNQTLANGLVSEIKGFYSSPEKRTSDVIPSIELFLIKLYCLEKIKSKFVTEDFKLDQDMINYIYRFAIEELLRRGLRSTVTPLKKTDILRILCPNFKKQIEEILSSQEKNQFASSNLEANYEKYSEEAEKLKLLNIFEGNHQEEKKEELNESVQIMTQSNKEQIIKPQVDLIASQNLWQKTLNLLASESSKYVIGAVKAFPKMHCSIMLLIELMKVLPAGCKDIAQLPMIKGEKEILLALILQNLIQPSNKLRTEAIKNGTYREIKNLEDAQHFLQELISKNLSTQIESLNSKEAFQNQLKQSQINAKLFVHAPDAYYAASILKQNNLFNGKGDLGRIIDEILNTDKPIKDAKLKLQLLQLEEINGDKFLNDKLKKKEPSKKMNKIKKQKIYKLWLNIVRKRKLMTENEFVEAFPSKIQVITLWNECLDDQGLPNKDRQKWQNMIQLKKDKKREKKAQGKAQIAQSKMF